MPTRGQGFSRCKRKEIAADDPAAKIVGEDAPLFKLKHAEVDEGGHDPDSECALALLTRGTMLTPIFRWHLVTTCLYYRVACGFLFATETQRCLGPLWFLRSPILIYAKVLHSPCPFSLSSDQALCWVGRSG